jgi:hypothetical protein
MLLALHMTYTQAARVTSSVCRQAEYTAQSAETSVQSVWVDVASRIKLTGSEVMIRTAASMVGGMVSLRC